MYDLDKMREDIDMRKILPQILSSSEIKYAGSTMYAKCVSGLHDETRIEHNAVSKKYCHCFSCGENQDAFSYIKKYYEQQGFSLSFSEICEKIGDALGGADYYKTDEKKISKKTNLLNLSTEELRIIGIINASGKDVPTLCTMLEKEPEKTKELVLKRAHESMNKYKALSEQLEEENLRQKYIELYQKCREIYEKLGGSEKGMVLLFRI